MSETIDTFNKYLVGIRSDMIGIGLPVLPVRGFMNKEEALNLAAWIVVLVDDDKQFDEVRNAIRLT